MKYFLFFVLFITGTAYGQMRRVVETDKIEALTASREKGEFHFQLPADLTNAEVERASSYYTKSFTVVYNQKSHEAVLTLTENTAANRKVIKRFFISLNVELFQVEGQNLNLEDFYQKHLK